jgi:hypothetical protein
MKKLLFGMLFATIAFGTNTAFADGWPLSVVGNWSVQANRGTGTLSITSQGTSGNCEGITGTIYGGNPIQGFYCPFSGRIHFLRSLIYANGTLDTIQAYTGNVSQTGATLHIGGIFADTEWSFGEYNFQASK